MSSITTFNFVSQSVRVVVIDDNPWFVAADVCAALELPNITMALKRLDVDEMQLVDFSTLNSVEGARNQQLNPGQQINIINESGLYSLILTSRKPEAKKFKKWVTSEVLPAIRKTGRYEAPRIEMPALVSAAQLNRLSDTIWCMARAFYMEGSVRHWLGKYACALARVSRREHIPASLYPAVADFLNGMDKAVMAYRIERIEHEKQWLLLTLKRELDRRAGRSGPEFEMLAEDREAQQA